jgi:hypothetical protein
MNRKDKILILAVAGAVCVYYVVYNIAWQWDVWPRRAIMTTKAPMMARC